GLAAQMRENFAGKMERTSNQNWIWCLPGQSQSFINRSRDGAGECWRDGRKNFRYYVGISRAFASNFRQKNRLANRRTRFTDSTSVLGGKDCQDERGSLSAKIFSPCFGERSRGSGVMCAIDDYTLVPLLETRRPFDRGQSLCNSRVADIDFSYLKRSNGKSCILPLMRTGKRDCCSIIRFGHEFSRRLAFSGSHANHFLRFRSLRRTNDRNFLFDDSSFFSSDFGNCFTQPIFVIEIDCRNHGDIRLNGVRGVEPTAETSFQDNNLDLPVREVL